MGVLGGIGRGRVGERLMKLLLHSIGGKIPALIMLDSRSGCVRLSPRQSGPLVLAPSHRSHCFIAPDALFEG